VPSSALKQPVEVAIPQALRFIKAGISKMDSLLSGFLGFSRLGRVSLSIGPIDMNSLIAEVVQPMRFQLDQAKVDLRIENLPPCMGDITHTGQIFSNLFDNALKYRDPARPLQVAVTGRVEGGDAIYAVADNGIGIAPEHQAKIFEIFHRLNPDATTGEGLGLTIAQRILERQNGKIWVESQEGVGSTFFVSLPARKEAS
jgi:signal transduction histidine kinase